MSSFFKVDPDGLESQANPYLMASNDFEQLESTIAEMESTYGGSFGNDDLGNSLSPQFRQTIETLKQCLTGAKEALTHNATGLKDTARTFNDASNEGVRIGNKLDEKVPQSVEPSTDDRRYILDPMPNRDGRDSEKAATGEKKYRTVRIRLLEQADHDAEDAPTGKKWHTLDPVPNGDGTRPAERHEGEPRVPGTAGEPPRRRLPEVDRPNGAFIPGKVYADGTYTPGLARQQGGGWALLSGEEYRVQSTEPPPEGSTPDSSGRVFREISKLEGAYEPGQIFPDGTHTPGVAFDGDGWAFLPEDAGYDLEKTSVPPSHGA